MDEEERANLNYTEDEIEQFRREKIEHQLRIKNFNVDEAIYSEDQKKNKQMRALFRDLGKVNENLNMIIDDSNKINNDIEKKEKKFFTSSTILLNGKKVLQLINKISYRNNINIHSSFRYRNIRYGLAKKINFMKNNYNVVLTYFKIQQECNVKIKLLETDINK
jgi:hypothetical protein